MFLTDTKWLWVFRLKERHAKDVYCRIHDMLAHQTLVRIIAGVAVPAAAMAGAVGWSVPALV